MSEKAKFNYRLSKAAKEFNIGKEAIVKFLATRGFQIDSAPNTKLSAKMYALLVKEFQGEKDVKEEARKLSTLSYKGGSASIKSIIDNVSGTAPANEKHKAKTKQKRQKKGKHKLKGQEELVKVKKQEKSKESNMETKVEYDASFSELKFEQGYISIIFNKKYCIYRDYRIRDFNNVLEQIYTKLNKGQDAIKTSIIKLVIDLETESFTFKDIDIIRYVNRLKDVFLPEKKQATPLTVNSERKTEKHEKREKKQGKRQRIAKTKIEQRIPFSEIEFGQGTATIIYKERQYVYRNNKIKDYDSILEQIYNTLPYAKQNSIKTCLIKVVIDVQTGTFTFKDIDIRKLVNDLKNRFLNSKKAHLTNKKIEDKDEPQKSSPTLKTMTLEAGNIHFFNGYYLIFQTTKGEIDNSVAPYRVNDPNSHEILNLIHKYFEKILEEMRIIVEFDDTTIVEPSKLELFKLGNYVRELKRNLDEKDVWWEEVQNARKRSFVQCCGEPTESVKKRVAKSKNEFLYNLSSLQNEKKLIRVYEINSHGKEEDAFIFTISMSNNRCAIVFENASNDASTSTWIFVAKDEDYEACLNLVFDYFTDYTISLKRSSLRDTINPPEKFKAESYASIYHDDIGQWLKKLNKILGQTPEYSEIQFVPGLHVPESSETRTDHGDTITTKHLHNQLMRKLYDKLCGESGKDNVGTEIRVGGKRIDTVVKGNNCYDIYEIKTATNPFDCVTEALGQLCQYAFLYCPNKIGKLVIVGPSETTKEVEQYLSTLRKNHFLQLYYLKV